MKDYDINNEPIRQHIYHIELALKKVKRCGFASAITGKTTADTNGF